MITGAIHTLVASSRDRQTSVLMGIRLLVGAPLSPICVAADTWMPQTLLSGRAIPWRASTSYYWSPAGRVYMGSVTVGGAR